MANLKNWLPEMTPEERRWFDKCPKAVLFEIARQFGMCVADNFTAEGGFAKMVQEWEILNQNGIVPQKPPNMNPKPVQPGPAAEKRIADRIDGFDRDDLGESPDY